MLTEDKEKEASVFEGTAPGVVEVVVASPQDLAQNPGLAAEIAAMYEAALGKGGVGAPGHEAYPDSDLFSEAGVRQTIEAGERLLGLAVKEGTVVGAMVIDSMSPYQVEFNSMAVPLTRRGEGIGSRLVAGLTDILEEKPFVVNCTELVTHSLASQSAHIHNGFSSICGFGFCHYPHVFFADHPESVLWATRLQGKLLPSIKKFRSALGRRLGKHAADVKQKLVAGQASGQVSQHLGRLDGAALDTVAEVLKERMTFVPHRYAALVEAILFQFENILDRTVQSYVSTAGGDSAEPSEADLTQDKIKVETIDGFGHGYIKFAPDFVFDARAIDKAIEQLKGLDKRFIKVMLPAHNQATVKAADHLNEAGFVFHSYLPLYGIDTSNKDEGEGAMPELYDVLSLQWIKPEVVANNAMPGQTASVIKIYGYPENLSGQIVKIISLELNHRR